MTQLGIESATFRLVAAVSSERILSKSNTKSKNIIFCGYYSLTDFLDLSSISMIF